MSQKIKNYTVLKNVNLEALIKDVNALIQEDNMWILLGGLVSDGDDFYQTLYQDYIKM